MSLVDRNFIWTYEIFFGAITGDDVSRKNRFIGVKLITDPPPPPPRKNGLEKKTQNKNYLMSLVSPLYLDES